MEVDVDDVNLPRHERPIPWVFEEIFARDSDHQHLDSARDERQDRHKHRMRPQRGCRQLQASTYHDEGQAEGPDLGGRARPEHVMYIVDVSIA